MLFNNQKLSSIMYKLMLRFHVTNPTKFKWISYTKSIMNDCGLSFMWNDQVSIDKYLLKTTIRQKLNDQFIQHWFSQINNTSRGEFYSLFKNEFQLESYLLKLTQGERINITKFRCSNIKFPIETGRWAGIPKENRTCDLCKSGIGNEFHFLFKCEHPEIKELRL